MKLKKIEDVEAFIAAVNRCRGDVWLFSAHQDQYNLKSPLSQYVALGALLGKHGDELELFCAHKEDEVNFYKLFNDRPEML